METSPLTLQRLASLAQECLSFVDENGVTWLMDPERTFRVSAPSLAARLGAAYRAVGTAAASTAVDLVPPRRP